jgi:hypothetical protein
MLNKPYMIRTIAGVVCGYLVTGMLIFGTDSAAGAMFGKDQNGMGPHWYLGVSILTGALYALLGGFVCTLIARERPRQALIALLIVGELVGVASTAAYWGKVPLWYSLGLLIVYPPAVWLGGRSKLTA